ncbi:hypothetical protein BC834DRAFT_1014196 [Gloeopeniophorella convolvens]|nr:hypothetical protein BC834DRAFT_1014196 [Gloeopeniophorella convolvens]
MNFSLQDHFEKLEKRRREAFERPNPFIPPKEGCPIDSLPNELLSYIFTLGTEAEEDGDEDEDEEDQEMFMDILGQGSSDDGDDDESQLSFQVLVSHVCQRWRKIAINSSTLWTHLDFAEGPPFDKSRAWLERSKECPLDIEIDCTIDDDDDDSGPEDEEEEEEAGDTGADDSLRRLPGRITPGDLPVVRDMILPHAARWRIFELMVNDYHIMHGILSTLASVPAAPQLQALRLYHYDDNEDYAHFSPAHLRAPFAPFGGAAPALVQLALWGVHVDWAACAFLEGLEELELAYHAQDVRPPYDVFVRALQRSPALHILTLCASGPAGEPEDWPTDVVELPSVKHLVLAFIDPPHAGALLRRLVFPGLTSLALDFEAEDYGALLAQLTRPSPGLQHSICQHLLELKISGMQCSRAAATQFYQALPNLVTLNLNCYHLDAHFFDLLHVVRAEGGAPPSCHLPRLETLTTAGVTGAQMRELVRQRAEVRPLKRVLMDHGVDVSPEDEDYLRRHVESLEYFDASDDEDDPAITELDEDEEDEDADAGAGAGADEQVIEGDADGVPGEWVDDDEPME